MKKCLVIFNPSSGIKRKRKDTLNKILDKLKANNYDAKLEISKYPGHIREIVRTCEKQDLIISIGGDGTFNETVNGNFDRDERLVLAHLPIGTANDIGNMYGYTNNILKNVDLLLNGVIKDVDICKINNEAFVYVAGFGKFVNVSYETEREKKKFWGYLAYVFNAVKEFFSPTKLYHVKYEVNGETHDDLVSFMLISNANRIAGLKGFYKEVRLDDNQFEVLLCSLTKRSHIIRSLYYLAKGDITKAPGFKYYKTNHLKFSLDEEKKNKFTVDGDLFVDLSNNYEITIERNVKIMMPKKNTKDLFVDNNKI